MLIPLFLVQTVGVTAYAGYDHWSVAYIPLFAALWLMWDVFYFAPAQLYAPRRELAAFLLRRSLLDMAFTIGIYGAGWAIRALLG